MSEERALRKTRVGKVVSDKMDKTIVVAVQTSYKHPLYGKIMKINKIKERSSPELEKELGELKTELFKLKFSLATNSLDNPMKIRDVKKDIARINTVLTERKIAEKKGVNE